MIKKTSPETATPKSFSISHPHILRSVLGNWSYLIVVSIIAFAMTPFVVRHLGNAAYGIWALVLQLTGYMGVVDVGLRSALVRFVSSANAKNDQVGISRLLSCAMMIYGVMAPLSILVGVVLAVFVLPHMHIGSDMLRTAQITLLISALIMASDFLFATFHAILAGLSRWDLINAVGICAVLIRTILIIAFIRHGYGLITLALIQLGTTVAGYLVEMLMVRRAIPGLRFIWKKPDRKEFAPVLQHTWFSFLLSLANRINYQVDTVVIAIFLPIGEVTFYVIGLRLIEYLRDVLNSTTMIASPLVSSLEAMGESDRVVTLLIRGTKYSLLVAFLGAAIFLTLGTKFIGLWMGAKFAAPSGRVLFILSVGLLVSATQFTSSHVLYGLGRHRINLNWTIVESLVNLAFSILLVRKYGIFGVAAGTTIANILVRGWFYPRSVLKDLGVPWGKYLREAVLPSIPPIVAFLAGSLTYTHFFNIPNYTAWFIAMSAGVLPFLIFLWFFALDLPERKLIWDGWA